MKNRGSTETRFDISELEEYEQYLINLAEKTMPTEMTKFMRKQATNLKNKVKKNASNKVKKKTGNYLKGWKKGRVYEYRGVKFNIRVYNNNPIAHLLEYGHVIRNRDDGPELGYKEGLFILENSRKDFEKTFYNEVFDFIDELLDKGLS